MARTPRYCLILAGCFSHRLSSQELAGCVASDKKKGDIAREKERLTGCTEPLQTVPRATKTGATNQPLAATKFVTPPGRRPVDQADLSPRTHQTEEVDRRWYRVVAVSERRTREMRMEFIWRHEAHVLLWTERRAEDTHAHREVGHQITAPSTGVSSF